MSPQEQLRVLLAMMLCGAALGAAYDALWLLRRTLLQGRAALAAMDLMYGVLCAAGVVTAAFILRVDALRWYTFAGTLAGMGIWRASAGATLRRIWGLGRDALKKISKRNGK